MISKYSFLKTKAFFQLKSQQQLLLVQGKSGIHLRPRTSRHSSEKQKQAGRQRQIRVDIDGYIEVRLIDENKVIVETLQTLDRDRDIDRQTEIDSKKDRQICRYIVK